MGLERAGTQRRRAWATSGLLGLCAAAALASPAGAQVDPPFLGDPIAVDGSTGDFEAVPYDTDTGTWQIEDRFGSYSCDGACLFHSFARFNVPFLDVAEFSAENGAPNSVIARVTGAGLDALEASLIEGTIRVLPDADFLLMNPAGVFFKNGAALDVPGSFYATSADFLRFDDAAASEYPSALSAPPSILQIASPLEFGFLPENESPGKIDFAQVGVVPSPLSVEPGETLAAIGGEVSLLGSNRVDIQSPGSLVALVGAGPGVSVPTDVASFALDDLAADAALGKVSIGGSARIFVSGTSTTPSGSVFIRGGEFTLGGSTIGALHQLGTDAPDRVIDVDVLGALTITDGSLLQTSNLGGGRGGDLHLGGDTVHVTNGSVVVTFVSGAGAGGDIEIDSGSFTADAASVMTSFATGVGSGGGILVGAAGEARVEGGAALTTENHGAGVGGRVELAAEAVSLSGGGIVQTTAQPTATVAGGAVDVTADSVSVSDAGFSPRGTFIATGTVSTSPSGAGGSLTVTAPAVTLNEGGQIFTRTEGAAPGGTLTVQAEEVVVDGLAAPPELPADDAPGDRPSQIAARALGAATGTGGALSIQGLPDPDVPEPPEPPPARRVEVTNGAVVGTETQSLGAAGKLTIRASDQVLVQGGPLGRALVSSASSVSEGSPDAGPGGDIEIFTDRLDLEDGGLVTATTTGTQNAGLVHIEARQATISGVDPTGAANKSGVVAQTLAQGDPDGGQGGSIEMVLAGDLEMSDEGTLRVETSSGGDAGTIDLDIAGELRMDAASISALGQPASTGKSGSIDIDAGRGVFLANASSIAAVSEGGGPAGSIDIDAGPRLTLTGGSAITTDSDQTSGGQITIAADELVFLEDSTITTSVSQQEGDAGQIDIDPALVTLNRSEIRGDADQGDGGRIRITGGAFVASSTSVVSAHSRGGIDGVVAIESLEVDVSTQVVQLPRNYDDAAALMKAACATRGREVGSFVVSEYGGIPASPDGPLPSPAWDAWSAAGAPIRTVRGPGAAATLADVRIAGLHCPHEQREVIR